MRRSNVMKVLGMVSAVTLLGCGNLFDYNAQEFKNLNDSGKRFENIQDSEIDSIIKRLIDQKGTIVSPVQASSDLASMSTNIIPGALTTSTTALLDAGDNPCKGSANIIECQPLQAKFYFGETKKLVDKLKDELAQSFGRAALLLDIKFDAKNNKPTSRVTVPASIRPLLPSKWRDSELSYNAPCRYDFKMLLYGKRDEADTAITPLSFLVVSSEANRKTGESDEDFAARKVLEAACRTANKSMLYTFPSEMDAYTNKYFFSIDGKTGKIKDAESTTVANMYLGYKDANNFYVQAQMASVPCQATTPAAPKNAIVTIVVEAGVWKGRIMSYSQHFGDKRDTPCSKTDEDYDSAVYMDTLANATHVVTTSYTVDPSLTNAQVTTSQIATSSTAIIKHCDAGRWSVNQCNGGKVGTEAALLSSYGAHACVPKDATKVDKWFAFDSYDSTKCGGLKTSDYLGVSYWRQPKFLKDDMSALKVPEDKDI